METDTAARRRNESEWKGLINAINSYEGSSFMYKAINFVKSCDISVSKINAFRKAMINGTPETIEETNQQRYFAELLRKFAGTLGLTIDSRLKAAAIKVKEEDDMISGEFGDI